tara:strand:+ start:905 stop:1786 length:882 start_codon:yes stop_codon:yes gene_type:complete
MRSHHLRAAGGSRIEVEDLRTELQKVGDAIKTGRTNYKISTYQGSGTGHYNISYDGGSTRIDDGGGDMYDAGNYTYCMTENWPASGWTGHSDPLHSSNVLYYTQTTVDMAIGQGYTDYYKYVSGGYGTVSEPTSNKTHDQAGTLIMALTAGNYNTSSNMKVGFAHAGNLGADSSGTTAVRQLYNNATVDGFTVYAWDITTYNAGDPVICNLYIFLGHSKWGTSFGTFSTYAASDTNQNGRGVWSQGTQNNILAITALIAADNSGNGYSNQHTTSQLTPIIDDIIADIKSEFGY